MYRAKESAAKVYASLVTKMETLGDSREALISCIEKFYAIPVPFGRQPVLTPEARASLDEYSVDQLRQLLKILLGEMANLDMVATISTGSNPKLVNQIYAHMKTLTA